MGIAKSFFKQFFIQFREARHFHFTTWPSLQLAEFYRNNAGINFGCLQELVYRQTLPYEFSTKDIDIKLNIVPNNYRGTLQILKERLQKGRQGMRRVALPPLRICRLSSWKKSTRRSHSRRTASAA